MKNSPNDIVPVLYSCYQTQYRDGQQFIPEHLFSHQIAGTLLINDDKGVHTINEGDFIFCRRNCLIKAVKQPPLNGEYKAITLFIDQEALRAYAREFDLQADKVLEPRAIVKLRSTSLYKSYMDSLAPYQQLTLTGNEELFALKIREAILLLLKINPEIKDHLFDFGEPGKLDLREFMIRNFRFNVGMDRFAYLTGRSLATFKRDFDKTFNAAPGKWLQQTRLEEAYFLIKQRNKRPSDVYLEVGFETISHFSFAFKQFFGVNPSAI